VPLAALDHPLAEGSCHRKEPNHICFDHLLHVAARIKSQEEKCQEVA
jgi:hypothetical protein